MFRLVLERDQKKPDWGTSLLDYAFLPDNYQFVPPGSEEAKSAIPITFFQNGTMGMPVSQMHVSGKHVAPEPKKL